MWGLELYGIRGTGWLVAVASWVKVAANAFGVPTAVETKRISVMEVCQLGLPAPHYGSGTHTLRKPPALQPLTSVHCYVRLNNSQHLALKLAHCRQSN